MAFSRPTLQTIISRIKGDFKTGFNLQSILRRSFLDVFAKTFGGVSHTLHGHIDSSVNDKFFPDTGDEATVVRWGNLFKLPRKDATFAELTLRFTGTTGGTLTLPTTLVRTDGILYDLQVETVVPSGGTVDASVVCQTEGEIGNMENDDSLSLQSSVPGVESVAVVQATVIEGEELEPLEDYRVRVLERLQFPPAGGTANDYIAFVKTVAGITRAWALPGNRGEGSTDTTFVEDGNAPASIIPSAAKVDEVQLAVDNLKPVEADHVAFAPIEAPMNPEIELKPNTTEVQNAVIAELEDLILREAEVRNAIDPLRVGDGITFDGKIKLSQIGEAISLAKDETDHNILFPTKDFQPSEGGLVTLGTPVFTPLA